MLLAAPNLADVPTHKPERCHPLTGERAGQFAVDLKQPFRLVFIPNHDPIPSKPDGLIDLTQITSIKVLSIEDYH